MLLQALQRAAILSNEKFRGVRWMLTEDSLRISCSNTEQEEAQEELEIDYQGEPLDVGFNVTYLLDVLANLDAPTGDVLVGRCQQQHADDRSGSDAFPYVVMPMRI